MQPNENIIKPDTGVLTVDGTTIDDNAFTFDLEQIESAIKSDDLKVMPTIKTADDFDKWLNDWKFAICNNTQSFI